MKKVICVLVVAVAIAAAFAAVKTNGWKWSEASNNNTQVTASNNVTSELGWSW